MRTLGIDLASQPRKTAACRINWDGGAAAVVDVAVGVSDATALALAAGCDAVGIDAPFGWPAPFVAFLAGAVSAGPGDGAAPVWDDARRIALSFRRTDLWVWERLRRPPLSVATDRIALPALRCAGLLAALGVVDRAGDGRVFEVYPAAALRAWGLASSGYKPRRANPRANASANADTNTGAAPRSDPAALRDVSAALLAACPWLRLAPGAAALIAASDDAFDALVAALIARAAVLGLTHHPPPEDTELARVEGWIAVPTEGSLEWLALEPRSGAS